MAEISDKIIITKHIKDSLNSFAEEYFLAVEECDFKILKSDTYIKSSATDEFELFSKEIIKEYAVKSRLINEHIEFEQHHKVVLYKIKECTIKLNYSIDYGEHASHPKIIISPDSIIPSNLYSPKELLALLYTEINKIKAYNGIIIRIFDEEMIKNLKILVKYIYANKFKKRVRILLFSGIEPIITRESKLIFWFQEKGAENQVIEVDADELLIEFKKPIFGENGFNAYGQNIDANYANNMDDLETEIDKDSIYIEEDENSKKYIAKVQGFVHYNKKILSVNNKIKLHKLSRNSQSIASQEDNNIEVTISQHDTNRDSIGEGVELVSETIHIKGFVGANSILEAVNLDIEGATHQDSIQFARYANINRHKGTLRCHKATIALLEGGEVHATSVDIESCLGGSIYAQDVTIGHVKSNLKVFASNSITINLVSGEDNKFEIFYKNIPILQSKLELIDEDIDDLKFTLEEATRHNPSKVSSIKKEIQTLRDEKENILHSYKNAKITIKQPLRGLNSIIFKIDTENEILFKTQAEEYSAFFLEIDNNKYTLQPVGKSIQIEE